MTLWMPFLVILLCILLSAEIFSNALEYLGKNLGISTGLTGSIFAAVATALPETMIPILALLAGTQDPLVNQEISMGGILGAPLMIATLSICVMALSAVSARGIRGRLFPEISGIKRDLHFFLFAFLIAILAFFIPENRQYLKVYFSMSLVLIYLIYVICTVHASHTLVKNGHAVQPSEPLLLTKIGFKDNTITVILQLSIGLILLLVSAKGFINNMTSIADQFHLSTLLLSLILIPIATELPEKINSILWVRKKQDTLGFGNLTGALVFQGSLLPALGIYFTPWQANKLVFIGVSMTWLAAAWIRIQISNKGSALIALCLNGLLYLLYLGLVFSIKA